MAGLPVRVVTGVGYKTEKVLAELGAENDLFEPTFILKSINLPRQARDKTWGTLRGKTLSTGVQTISELREVVAAGGNDGGGQVRAFEQILIAFNCSTQKTIIYQHRLGTNLRTVE